MQKTPVKLEVANSVNDEEISEETSLKKADGCDSAPSSTPPKGNNSPEFKTPEKNFYQNSENRLVTRQINHEKTPIKSPEKFGLKSEVMQSCEGEDGMLSATEQARLLIAANKTPSKSVNKTPVKENTPVGRRSVENSPVTPGKYKRVELTTLASPKAKRIKQI